MIIRFVCHDCGQKYRAPEERSGESFPCRRCGWPCRVPGRGGKARTDEPREKSLSKAKN